MTPLQDIYDAFLAKILDDEWGNWEIEEASRDWLALLQGAVVWFKFPRHSLNFTDAGFDETLTNEEIQILAAFMKCEWLNRTILTWENIKPLYEERDFSQANLLSKFNERLAAEEAKARKLEAKYYRSINYKPFPYRKLADNDVY